MSRHGIVLLVIFAAAIGGAAGSALTLLLQDDDVPIRGSLVHLGPPDVLDGLPTRPFCVQLHHFCITQPQAGQVLALYTYDPHPTFREQGCEVRWDADAEQHASDGTTVHGLFRDPCGGSEYDLAGRRLFGPSPRDLDSFPAAVTENGTVVNTHTLICGHQRLAATHVCPRAPLGD